MMIATKEDLLIVDFIRSKVDDLEVICKMLERDNDIRDFRLKEGLEMSKKLFEAFVVLKSQVVIDEEDKE